jgi:hypothetical protein
VSLGRPPRSTLANGAVSSIRPTAAGVLASVSCSLMAGDRGGASAGRRATASELLARAAPTSRSALESGGA